MESQRTIQLELLSYLQSQNVPASSPGPQTQPQKPDRTLFPFDPRTSTKPPPSISRSPKPCSNDQSPMSSPKMMLALNLNLNPNLTNRKIRKIVAQDVPSDIAQDDARLIVRVKTNEHATVCSKHKGKRKMDAWGFAGGGGRGVKGA
ncbi:hypothetical protein C1H46_042694 [Malus baccata]|uniref:Uncharacterized protein n=1 Tax=Malus baccata TaxID=106549 RepID=A0A540KC13_MALBA|nr:hypothetical protein C1H46_042694 [Malus baccata]